MFGIIRFWPADFAFGRLEILPGGRSSVGGAGRRSVPACGRQ
jgi:hypothetical protein